MASEYMHWAKTSSRARFQPGHQRARKSVKLEDCRFPWTISKSPAKAVTVTLR